VKKIIIKLLSAVLIISSLSSFTSIASASENETTTSDSLFDSQSFISDEQLFSSLKNSPDFQWDETVLANGEIEYTLSDSQVIDFLYRTEQVDIIKQLDDGSEIGLVAAGVTKIVKNKYGGFDVYLSKLVVQTLAVGGSAAIGFLVSLIPGVGWVAAGVILGAMSAHLSTNIKHGKVFRFGRNWSLLKVWSQ